MQRAYLQHFDGVLNEVSKYFNPPAPVPEPDPDVIYVSEDEQGTGRLGHSDFNPRLMARPHRWW
jgi:hypothetical protein